MEVILIHRPVGMIPPEMATMGIQAARDVLSKPSEVVPGGKLIASYYARAQWLVVCVWEVTDLEALMPFLEGMRLQGWNTEVIPAEKGKVAVGKLAKALGI